MKATEKEREEMEALCVKYRAGEVGYDEFIDTVNKLMEAVMVRGEENE